MQRPTELLMRGLGLGLLGRNTQQLPRADRILLPVSGSSMDHQALELASQIAKSTKGSLFIVYVIEVPREMPLDAHLDGDVAVAESVLAEMEEFCIRRRCRVVTELLQARQMGPAIVNEISERNADLLILGMNHERRYGEYALGEAVLYVFEHAQCAVWVLREPVPIDARVG